MTALLVVIGGAAGAALRYVLGHLFDSDRLPWGTLAANTAGSVLLGILVTAGLSEPMLVLLGTGFCGALTTYAALALRGYVLGRRRGTAYVAATLALSLLGVAVGAGLGLALARVLGG